MWSKREFLKAGAVAAAGIASSQALRADDHDVDGLRSLTTTAQPITDAERQQRVAKAARLMRDADIGALLVEAGSALDYFLGIRWWRSERFTGAIITAEGTFAVVTPFFEGPSIREQMGFGDDVRTWHEDESPYALVVDYLREKGVSKAPLAIEETTRFFIVDGVRALAPALAIVSGDPVTRGCRMFKSPAELTLMQVANDVTMAAYRHVYPRVRIGMTPADISGMMNAATRALGAEPQFSMTLLGPASAYPHGTRQPQRVTDGGIVLMDCGASVHGYESDISRTWVVGQPSRRQRQVWDTVKAGQELALETIRPGRPAGEVDRRVRAFYAEQGFGPDYETPGLTHRLGHGIGMDGHEPINFVRNETTALAPGMCFSNEPGLYLPGEFGVRLEDCLVVEADGPRLFSALSPSLDAPMG